MERRKFNRFPSSLTGVIIIEGKSYIGYLKNLSQEGIEYLGMLDFYHYHKEINPKKKVKLIVEKTINNNVINLDCEIIWTKGRSSDSSKPFIGIKILNPPNSYIDLINTLK